MVESGVEESAPAALTIYHRWCGSNNRYSFLTVLEAVRKPKVKVRQGWFLVRTLSLQMGACHILCPHPPMSLLTGTLIPSH